MYLIFDTETTGLPKSYKAPMTDTENWPRCIQIAWQLHDDMGRVLEHDNFMVQPDGFNIPFDSEKIHGISTELAIEQGISLQESLERFNNVLSKTKFLVGQNVTFDVNIMGAEFIRAGITPNFKAFEFDSFDLETYHFTSKVPKNRPLAIDDLSEDDKNTLGILDTCTEVTASMCQLPGGRGGKFKLPTLTELHQYLFGVGFGEAHNATADVEATTRCFFELIRKEAFTKEQLDVPQEYFTEFKTVNPKPFEVIGLKHLNLKKESEKIRKRQSEQAGAKGKGVNVKESLAKLEEVSFAHLHNHTQYSILQSTIEIGALVSNAGKHKMSAVAMTDTGNMMAAFHFTNAVSGHNSGVRARREEAEEKGEDFDEKELVPIVGCEFFVCEDHLDKSKKDNGYQVVMLAKNRKGYQNLAKMSSTAFVDGFYYVPRIDRKVIEQYKEDVIVLTGNLYGEVPSKILNIGEKQAEEALLWWKEQFGDDLYIEIMRHGQEDENVVNKVLLEFAKKHDVKVVATNNTFYIDQEDANAHDILLCVKDGEKQATPIGRGRGYRYGLPNDQYYFKTPEEMKELFVDIPEAISNIQELVDKITPFTLASDVLLPAFDIPEEFKDPKDLEDGGKRGENNFLGHLVYEGAKKRYGEITPEIKERLDLELDVIAKTGYPGYFLIVEDFIRAARDMGVSVGPGRGSAAGSVAAYCLWITNIDPIKYDLLFERFLNPERVSMPDIDIDFDDEGRGSVIDYVIKKYGANQVAQIITYGTMAAKSSIRDTARVLDLPLFEADRIAKLIPGMKLKKIFGMDDKELSSKLRSEEMEMVNELKRISEGVGLEAETVNKARVLEGSVRNTGIHACGVIITPDDITKFVPVSLAKDSDMYVTQFDNSVVESAGLLKMDFLGLKTLTLIKHTCKIVKARHGIELDPESFPIDDEETYKLFQRGETVGIFQYESPGMQKYMRELKPTVFADLIAMNALYRPGPLEYIPNFIDRKHGREEIVYDLPDMDEYLAETYGITVYQEQVMLLSQSLAGFTKGQADTLRKAMGKKQIAVLAKMKPLFIEQAAAKGYDPVKLEKVWKDWEAFASYAFNKSHSTCYAWIAYQTAYLKAHYPAEYMAAVLSNNMNDIKQVTFFMEECKRMGLTVLGPDVNESYAKFSVNDEGAVRFGMAAIKGVGGIAVDGIINERKENGPFVSIFDVAKRVDLRTCNKKAFEGLALAGGFDSFGNVHRAQFFATDDKGMTFLEKAMKFGHAYQESMNSSQVSLFGEASDVQLPEPLVPPCETWGTMELLSKEKEVVGIYISAHPLDDYRNEMKFTNCGVSMFKEDLKNHVGKNFSFAGILTSAEHRIAKNGNGWGAFIIEDYTDSHEFRLFGEDYMRFQHLLVPNSFLYLSGTIQRGWMQKDGSVGEPRVKFSDFSLLSDVMDKKCKKITFKLRLHEIRKERIEQLEMLLSGFTGEGAKQTVGFNLISDKDKIDLEMPSRTYKLNMNTELFDYLDKEGFEYKLN
ncbi:DNA polymerase III subunit alpha [Wenyingzhuangia marina]|uniref:DNA polymerase III subunit alpha n=1 Tax=Wenyingzhuangia marina TaxID=1195760 RepID=A0A1M5UQ39_9FLAO|nr:DNA polymerase III subunit alpha [Wenyingzhuangia marina]GGF66506.1 DNA-directed DNA polymerase [Wenyingzhuangia marina]SHH65044.1 DNA polymerase III, alpha subunit [Wenyingzhuangia marina]